MRGKTAKKLRRFAANVVAMNPTKSVTEVYDQLKIVHNKKTNTEKYATYQKVKSSGITTKAK